MLHLKAMSLEKDGKRAVASPVKGSTASIIPINKRPYQKKTVLTADVTCASGICQASEEFGRGKMKQCYSPLGATTVHWSCFMRILKVF